MIGLGAQQLPARQHCIESRRTFSGACRGVLADPAFRAERYVDARHALATIASGTIHFTIKRYTVILLALAQPVLSSHVKISSRHGGTMQPP
jgi:hypothetical protein